MMTEAKNYYITIIQRVKSFDILLTYSVTLYGEEWSAAL